MSCVSESSRSPQLLLPGEFASPQSTEVYLRADPSEKLEALSAMAPPMLKPGRFRSPDKVLAMLTVAKRKSNYAE